MVFTGGFKWPFACVIFSYGKAVKWWLHVMNSSYDEFGQHIAWLDCTLWETVLFLRVSNLSVTHCVILSYLPASCKSQLFSLFHLLYVMTFMNSVRKPFTASASVCSLHYFAASIKPTPHRKHVITTHNLIQQCVAQVTDDSRKCLQGHVIQRARTPPLQIPPMMHAGMVPCCCICRQSETSDTLFHTVPFLLLSLLSFFQLNHTSGIKWIQSPQDNISIHFV